MQYTDNHHFALPGPSDTNWADAVNQNFVTADDFAYDGAFALPAMIMLYAGVSDPPGWLICDGRAVSRTTYAALFAAIGTTFGAGDGTSTFQLPDLRDRFVCGAGSSTAIGATGGAAAVTLSAVPEHTHTVNVAMNGNHTHTAANDTSSSAVHAKKGSALDVNAAAYDEYFSDIAKKAGGHVHAITIGDYGSGNPSEHENRPPFVTMNSIIKI